MVGDDVLYLTVAELSTRIRARTLSPVELTDSYLARIEKLDAKLHAFVTVMGDDARREAKAAEQEIAAGKYRGPLHGIPYGAKDLLATRGTPTTWGARPLKDQRFDYDATVITRLREAGAILLGKLAMVELAGGLGYTIPGASLTGAARNPWDTTRWTCGSSSGSGAAVSAALVAFAIGSETWGSIICPSTFSGISGLRPTFGRVSRHGAMALSWTMDKLGPMARSAEDCELVLAAIAGHDPLDAWSSAEMPHPKSQGSNPNSQIPNRNSQTPNATAQIPGPNTLRVAFVAPEKGTEPEVAKAYDRALEDLRALGVSAREVKLPDLPFEAIAGVIISAEATAAFEDLFRDGRVRQLADRNAPLALAQARAISGTDLVKALRIRTMCQRAMAEFFGNWDVLLAPGEPMTAFPADESFAEVSWSDPVGAMGNVCGLPAVAVPCGFGKASLPAGLSMVGGAFEEATVLALARAYQRTTDWHRRRPPVA
jgi:aspartyl-tRNA(Asn)/glutamyl-tRNA(Gln) amidotransferase subunit A